MNRYVVIMILLIYILCGCSRHNYTQPISSQNFQLDTLVTITIYDSNDRSIFQDVFNEIDRLESILSAVAPGSDPDRLAQNAGKDYIQVSDDTIFLLERCVNFSNISGGAFDCTVGPLVCLWNIKDLSGYYPTSDELKEALALIGYQNVLIRDDKSVMLKYEGMKVDFGGIAKGYIADKVKELLISKGVNSAIIDLGGNIVLLGGKPNGANFRIGVRDPVGGSADYLGVFELKDKSLVSSGTYERYFMHEGTRYHHIMDVKTGFPVENELMQVTVISDSSADGDGLSTAAFALGLDQGYSFINGIEGVDAVFVTKDMNVYITDGIRDSGQWSVVSDQYSDQWSVVSGQYSGQWSVVSGQ